MKRKKTEQSARALAQALQLEENSTSITWFQLTRAESPAGKPGTDEAERNKRPRRSLRSAEKENADMSSSGSAGKRGGGAKVRSGS
eukprot:281199-Hanusia_phi.AAC.1